MKDKDLAPVVLFVFNRPEHTVKTISALQHNELAKDTILYIYCDGARNDKDALMVNRVHEIVDNVTGFKSVKVFKNTSNIGLAKSIINGVTKIVNKHGRVIVLEDDLVTSRYFLTFMNNALEQHKDSENLYHISGWNYPINAELLPESYFIRIMNCWGWATWKDRWNHFEKDVNKLISQFNSDDIHKFNVDGNENFWNQVLSNKKGLIDTWAIFWYACIFKRGGLCLNPAESLVSNIGFDGSGQHKGKKKGFESDLRNANPKINIGSIEESTQALDLIKKYYKDRQWPIHYRLINKISRIIIKKNILNI